jgi:hypothetical protein
LLIVARRGLCHRGIVGLKQLLQLIDRDDRDWLIARKACCVAKRSPPTKTKSSAVGESLDSADAFNGLPRELHTRHNMPPI